MVKIANVLAVRPDFPAKSVEELLAYGKANPGKLTFASQGVGSTAHLSGSELEVLGGIKMVHVPYHGAQPALTDLMSGNVDMFFDTLTTSVPLYQLRQVEAARRRQRRTLQGCSGNSHHRRIRNSRFPLDHLVCHGCAARHTNGAR